MKHFLSSLVNAGVVTIVTSGVMTILNSDHFAFTTWLRNWCISWSIVFVYVFLFAGRVSKKIHGLWMRAAQLNNSSASRISPYDIEVKFASSKNLIIIIGQSWQAFNKHKIDGGPTKLGCVLILSVRQIWGGPMSAGISQTRTTDCFNAL